MTEGVDISSWQGDVDFAQVKAAGKLFVILRGGDGRYRDPKRSEYRAGVDAVGLSKDAYHFLRWKIPAREMADLCIESCSAIGVNHIWLDAEDTDPQFYALSVTQRLTWLEAVGAFMDAANVAWDVYTGGWWWKPNMGNSTAFSHKRLWSAEYPGNNTLQAYDPARKPSLYGGWSQVSIWQYGSQGTVPGVESTFTDLNWSFEEIQTPQEDDMDADEKAAFRRYFVDPHGEGAYNARYPGRENWTRADVIFEGVAYLDAQHIGQLFAEHETIIEGLGGGGTVDVTKIRLTLEGD